jgi:hypothetical protein
MHPFTNTESYKHKCAKETFKQWCDSVAWSSLDGDGRCVSTNHTDMRGTENTISWRSNRSEEAWLEYPIVVNNDINSIEMNWDETWPGFTKKKEDPWEYYDDERYWNNFVPTYGECKEYNLQPIAVIDIVLPHKGRPAHFIEICHTNPISNEKLEKLKQLGICDYGGHLIEIDAEWILRQTKIPSKLQIKRWLI